MSLGRAACRCRRAGHAAARRPAAGRTGRSDPGPGRPASAAEGPAVVLQAEHWGMEGEWFRETECYRPDVESKQTHGQTRDGLIARGLAVARGRGAPRVEWVDRYRLLVMK